MDISCSQDKQVETKATIAQQPAVGITIAQQPAVGITIAQQPAVGITIAQQPAVGIGSKIYKFFTQQLPQQLPTLPTQLPTPQLLETAVKLFSRPELSNLAYPSDLYFDDEQLGISDEKSVLEFFQLLKSELLNY
jgi:hypothetical protein